MCKILVLIFVVPSSKFIKWNTHLYGQDTLDAYLEVIRYSHTENFNPILLAEKMGYARDLFLKAREKLKS
jgi:hypothetical protein